MDQAVKRALNTIIIPAKKEGVPIAPNFFLEAKSTTGTLEVTELQVMLDGAHGITSILALQNYLLDTLIYDGNAYTFSAAFISGYLHLYAHYLTPPAGPEQRPGYHIIQLNAYTLTGNHEGWLESITAFRNLTMLAKKYRDQFIKAANARTRARNAEVTVAEGDTLVGAEQQQDKASSPSNFFDCLPFTEPHDSDQDIRQT